MKTIDLKCPSCGASLQAEDGLETFYCQYCGHRIILSEQSKTAIGAKVVNSVLNHRERMYEKEAETEKIKREEQREEQKRNDRIVIIGILCFFILAFLFFAASLVMKIFGL